MTIWLGTDCSATTCVPSIAITLPSKVRGEVLDLWWLYNVVTQMGGWQTVFSNTWLRWVYKQKEEWNGMTDIGNRLKIAYMAFLSRYEATNFQGCTYVTTEEKVVPGGRGGVRMQLRERQRLGMWAARSRVRCS